MHRTGRIGYLALACALALPAVAGADATLQVTGSQGESTIKVKDGMGRMDMPDGNYMLFDRARNVVIHVEPADGGYTELDEATIGRMAQTANAMRSQMAPYMEAMKAQLANLPPEQRAMMEQRMAAMMGAQTQAPAAPIKAVKKGRGTVAGVACEQHELMQNGAKVADACVATSADGTLSKDDFGTLEAMMAFLRKTAAQAAELVGSMGDQAAFLKSDLNGVPLKVEGNGETFQVTSVSAEKIDNTLFTDYRNLKQKVIPGFGP